MKKSATSARSGTALGCMALFFGVFALVGLGTLWALGLRPLAKAISARSWVETPAEIVSSTLERHSGSDGSTYNVAIGFDYVFQGQRHHGSNYDFQTGSSSGTDSKQAVVDRFPVGARTTCWVNPKDPTEAVIDRNLGWWILFGLFPLLFLGAGLGGLVFVLAGARAMATAKRSPAAGSIGPA